MIAKGLTSLEEVVERIFGDEVRVPIFKHRGNLFHCIFDVQFRVFVELEFLGIFIKRAYSLLGLEQLRLDGSFLLNFLFLLLAFLASARPLSSGCIGGVVCFGIHYLEPKYI